jgi:hypothetical protein
MTQSCQSLEFMRRIRVENEQIECTNSNRVELQRFHDAIERVKTAQTD